MFENKIILFLLIATVVAAVIIGIFGVKGRNTSVLENAGGAVVSPVQGAVSGVGGWFGSIGEYFGSVKALRDENEALKSVNTSLQKQLSDMQGLSDENEELRKMLDLRERQTSIDMVAASVTAKDPSNWYSTVTINRGSNDGIKENQPVVNSNRELVGQVVRVGNGWAEVVTILDTRSSIGAMVRRSKEIGIIEGNSELRVDGRCRLGYIERGADIVNGDFVETSGLGGVFPKGLVIGTVVEIYDENSTMSKAATIEPLADIGKLNEVFVITDYEDADLTESDEEESEDESDDEDEDEEDSEDE